MTKTFEHDLDVVGLRFRMNKEKREQLAKSLPNMKVTLVREQENKYDENAIRVELQHAPHWLDDPAKVHIGYVRADSAAILAPFIDRDELVFKSGTLNALMDGNGGPNSEGRMSVVFTDKR